MLPTEHFEPATVAVPTLDIIRQRLDLMNRLFLALSADLDRINANAAELIGEHHEAQAFSLDQIQRTQTK